MTTVNQEAFIFSIDCILWDDQSLPLEPEEDEEKGKGKKIVFLSPLHIPFYPSPPFSAAESIAHLF